MAIAQQRMTLEQFLRLPEEKPALEFENGMVTQKVSPQRQHGFLQRGICGLIDRCGEPAGLAVALPEQRVTFADWSPVPDVAVYRWESIETNAVGDYANDDTVVPIIVFEIVSPEQNASDQAAKCRGYVERGVILALVVNHLDKSIGVFASGVEPRWLRGDDLVDLGDALPGCGFSAHDVFSALRK